MLAMQENAPVMDRNSYFPFKPAKNLLFRMVIGGFSESQFSILKRVSGRLYLNFDF